MVDERNDELERLAAALSKRVTAAFVRAEYLALAAHFHLADLRDEQLKRLASDWVHDLADLCLASVDLAFQDYRQSNAKFMATPGTIRNLALKHQGHMRDRMSQLKRNIGRRSSTVDAISPGPQFSSFHFPMTDSEWSALRKQIRHHKSACWIKKNFAAVQRIDTEIVVPNASYLRSLNDHCADFLRSIGATAIVTMDRKSRIEL
jgi:hypothetical protein